MNWGKMWEKGVLTSVRVLFKYFSGGTGENVVLELEG
jgi:hypothetical protein